MKAAAKKIKHKKQKMKASAQAAAALRKTRQQEKNMTVVVLLKNVRSLNSNELIAELTHEVEGYRWGCSTNQRVMEIRQSRDLGETPRTQNHGCRKCREQAWSWNIAEQEVAKKSIGQTTSTNEP